MRAAIGRAASRSGIDFNYLLGQARLESGLDPSAKSNASSASGLYQFIDRTWLGTVARHGAEHGLEWAAQAIEQKADGAGGAHVSDPAMRARIMALRLDPDTAAAMAGELAGDNRDALRTATGREPGPTELYLAHFLGSSGAIRFLAAAEQDSAQPAASLFPEAAASNRAVFFDHGAPRSVGALRDWIAGRIGRAMNGEASFSPSIDRSFETGTAPPPTTPLVISGGPIASAFHAIAASAPTLSQGATTRSMADTLRSTFALDNADALPASGQVRNAYARLRSFGL